jgi:hypothetical protein
MKTFAKAIYATIISALGSLAVVLVGDAGLGDLTSGQWITVVLAALIAGGGVYGITNAPAKQ